MSQMDLIAMLLEKAGFAAGRAKAPVGQWKTDLIDIFRELRRIPEYSEYSAEAERLFRQLRRNNGNPTTGTGVRA